MTNFIQSRIIPLVVGTVVTVLGFNSQARALDFNFSFTNFDGFGNGGNIDGTVTGIIKGLTNNETGPATEVDLISYPSGLGTNSLGNTVSSWTTPSSNSFTVSNGVITAYNFGVFAGNSNDDQFCISSAGDCEAAGSPQASLTFDAHSNSTATYGGSGVTFTSTSSAVPFEIPFGSTIPVFGSVLALSVMRKVRKLISNNLAITATEKVITNQI